MAAGLKGNVVGAGDGIVRPTLRCLFEDLASMIGPPELADALRTARAEMSCDARYLFPIRLSDASHPVLHKANHLANDEAADREPIELLREHHVLKVKTGHHRGALWLHPDGTWWLLAAGMRKNGEPGDFYNEIQTAGSDFARIAPTQQDLDYARYENAYLAECESEREAKRAVIRALLRAARTPNISKTVDVFGATVTITIVTGDEDIPEVTLSFDMTDFEEQDRFPADVIGCVPGHENVDDWDYLPSFRDSQPACWYTLIDEAWVEQWAAADRLDDLLTDGKPFPEPMTAREPNRAHLAPGTAVTVGYVEGIEITALCGTRMTPHRNPDTYGLCSACGEIFELLQRHPPGRENE